MAAADAASAIAASGGQAAALAYLKSRPGFLFKRTQQLASAFFMRSHAGAEITPGQFEALAAIEARPTVDQITLAGLLGIDRSTTTVVLDGLMNRGLIERRIDSDRRRRRLSGTKAAARALAAARRRSDEGRAPVARRADGGGAAPPRRPARPHRGDAGERRAALAEGRALARDGGGCAGARLDLRPARLPGAAREPDHQRDLPGRGPGIQITPGQYAVMVMINAAETLDQMSLAALIGADRSTTAVLVRLLEARGVVKRARAENDRRRRLAVIAPAAASC